MHGLSSTGTRTGGASTTLPLGGTKKRKVRFEERKVRLEERKVGPAETRVETKSPLGRLEMCPGRLEVTKGGPEPPLGETKTSLVESALRRVETNLPLGGGCRLRKPLVQSSLLVGRTTERKLEANQRKCRLKMTKFETK
jgi:hypothetical protein